MTPAAARWSPLAFLLLAAGVYATAALAVVPRLALSGHPDLLATALTLDLVVLVPTLYCVLLVRGRGWPLVSVAPVLIASVIAASFVVPDAYQGALRVAEAGVVAVELGVLALVAVRIRQVARATRSASGDAFERLSAGTQAALGDGLAARALAYEVAVLRYALVGWGERPTDGFGGLRKSGYATILVGIGIAGVVELVGVHLLLSLWSETAALLHLVVSGYALVWIWGDYQALRLRRTTFGAEALHVRVGLRWQTTIPYDQIERLLRVRRPVEKGEGTLIATPIGEPTHLLELNRPVTALGPYGIVREVTRLGLTLDDAAAFEAALSARI